MSSAFSLDDRARLLRWLGHGSAMAREAKGDRARPIDAIWLLFQNAVHVMDSFPDQEKRWMTSAYRSGGWSNVGLSYSEARQLEQIRLHAAIAPCGDTQARTTLAYEQDRAVDVLDFLRWCGVHIKSRRPLEMRKAAVALARYGDGEAFRRAWTGQAKGEMSRQAVSKFRQVLCGHILAGLREDCAIFPIPGSCEFV